MVWYKPSSFDRFSAQQRLQDRVDLFRQVFYQDYFTTDESLLNNI